MVRSSVLVCAPSLPTVISNADAVSDLPESSSTFLRDSDGSVSAVVSMVKYSPTQAYCYIAEFDSNINDKYVTVTETDDASCLQIDNVKSEPENMRLCPIYIQVHHEPPSRLPLEHLTGRLAESVLGQTNLELKKNVTVDLSEEADLDNWRDKAGFIVTDRQPLRQMTVCGHEFLKSLKSSKDVKVSKYNGSMMDKVLEYDHQISSLNRANFLQYFFADATVMVAQRENDDTVEGYLVAKRDRLLALYADSDAVAHTLAHHWLRSARPSKVHLCCRHQSWEVQKRKGTTVSAIHRLHTRAVPSNIKWDRVYALNVGMHII